MTNQEIINVGQQIHDETNVGANTSERVGGVIKGIGENLKNKDSRLYDIEYKTDDIERNLNDSQTQSIEIYNDDNELVGKIDDNGADFVDVKKGGESVLVPSQTKTINGQSIDGSGDISIREIPTDLIEESNTIETGSTIIIGTDAENETIRIEDKNTEIKGDLKLAKGEQVILETESLFDSENEPIIIGETVEDPTIKISDNRVDFLGKVTINGNPVVNDNNFYDVLLGVTNYQRPTKYINMFGVYGQSLSTGQQTCPELSRVNYRGNLMIGDREWAANQYNVAAGSSFSPLRARANNSQGNNYIPTDINDQTCGETCGVNACNAMKRLFDDYIVELIDRKFLDASFGAGGKSIELLSKNCPNNSGQIYAALEAAIDKIKAAADTENKTICCTVVLWMQGEWNESSHEDMGWFDGEPSTHNKDDYKAYLIGGTTSEGVTVNGMVNDLIATMMTKFHQDLPPIVLGSQMSEQWINYRSLPIMMAQLEASHETDKYIICSPTYRVTDRNGHLDANGSRWLAEFYAKVWYKVVILGQEWKPLQPVSIKRNNKSVEIEFHVPCPPLVFDTLQVRSVPNKGFSLWLNDADVTISNVSIVGNSVIIETNTDLMDGDLEVSYAGKGVKFGNLRDSDPWKAFEVYKDLDTIVENPAGVSYRPSFEPKDEEGNVIYNKPYPCQNFCVNFYYILENELNILNINI